MSIGEIENFIKRRKLTKIVFDPHAVTRVMERDLNEDVVKDIIRKKEIVSIEKQKYPKFRVTFKMENDNDINIVAKKDGKRLLVITAFPSKVNRREK